MTRKKANIILQNAYHVFCYFQNMLADYRRAEKMELDPDKLREAKDAFLEIEELFYGIATDPFHNETLIAALQTWTETYISAKTWLRYLSNLRQHQFKRERRMTQLRLPKRTYLALHYFAKEKGMSLCDAIYDRVKEYDYLDFKQ